MTGSPLVLMSVRVENVGVLRDVTLAPAPGLTVISGESGSGKSLLIRAIDMALGGRVDGERVGPFGDRARVTLEFQTGVEAPLWQEISGFGVEPDEMLVVSRDWGREARGSLRVQGRSVPLGVVRQLFSDSVDLVGQHEHQRLLRADSARRWLDALVDEELRDRVGRAWRLVAELDRERGELQAALGRDDLAAELRTEVAELQELELGAESEADLRREADRLQHGERLFGLYQSASELLDGGGSIAAVAQVVRLLGEARRFDQASADVLDAAAEAQGILEDVRRRLYRLAEGVEFDDRRLEVIRERLDRMARMARRYDTDVAGLGEALREREGRLARLEEAEWRLSALGRERDEAWRVFKEQSALLSEARRGRAAEAGQAVTAVLADLDMPGAAIEIAVEAADASQYGEDRMLWHFRPAPGAQWKNLADAASGGEMARVTLALTLVEPERGLMVFDEVDAGLGGHAARRVAELLDRLRRSGTAVITVTHQAVVAATADLHYRAEKQGTHGGFYEAHFDAVRGQARERELARMLSGSVDEAALQHARQLLEGSA